MSRFAGLFFASLAATLPMQPSFAADKTGCADHALFPTRMPEYALRDCKVEEHGIHQFSAIKGPKTPVAR